MKSFSAVLAARALHRCGLAGPSAERRAARPSQHPTGIAHASLPADRLPRGKLDLQQTTVMNQQALGKT